MRVVLVVAALSLAVAAPAAGAPSLAASGYPLFPKEVAMGRVDHAIRVTVDRSQAGYLWPARHAHTGTPPSPDRAGSRRR